MATPRFEDTDPLFDDTTPLASNPPAELTPPESKTRRFARGVAKALPVAGAIGGSFVAPIAGTAAGAAAGAGVKEAILSALGDRPEALIPGLEEDRPTLLKTVGRVGEEAGLAGLFGVAGKGLSAGGKFIKGAVTGTRPEAVRAVTQEAIETIGREGGEELIKRRGTAELAKKGLIEAEEKAGLHFKTSPEFEKLLGDPQRLAKDVQSLSRLTEQGPQKIAQNLEPENIQALRKLLQEAEKSSTLSDIAKSEMRRAKGILVEALKIKKPEVVEPLGKLFKAEESVRSFPKALQQQIKSRRVQGTKEMAEAIKNEKRRKVLQGLAALGTGSTLAGLILR